ncbi:MAG: pyridoxamine 5'-phosphate oxidase family protein [Bacteroidota bacterium]
MDPFSDFEQITDYLRDQFTKAAHQKRHPWRLVTLATVADGVAQQRTVVLRRANWTERSLRFYTDARSAKMEAIRAGQLLSFLFYHPRHQVQVRLLAQPTLADETTKRAIYNGLPLHATRDYRTQLAPGAELKADNPTYVSDPAAGFANFTIVENTFTELEILQLNRSGHRRARLNWSEDTAQWQSNWLVP